MTSLKYEIKKRGRSIYLAMHEHEYYPFNQLSKPLAIKIRSITALRQEPLLSESMQWAIKMSKYHKIYPKK